MKEEKEYLDLVQYAVDEGKKAKADASEAFLSDAESIQVSVNSRQVEQVNAFREAGIGLRLLKDQKLVFGSTNELSRKAIQNLIDDLMKKVPFHSPDEFNVIAGKESGLLDKSWATYTDLITYDPQISDLPVQEKIKLALQVETAAFEFSPKVTGSTMVIYQDGTNYTYLANSNGVSGWFPSSGYGGGAEMSAAEGEDHQSGSFFKTCAKYPDFDPKEVGQKAAENAVKMLGAKPIQSCEVPLVVSPEIGTQIFSYIANMLSADEIQKGKSLFAGKLESRVATETFNLIDDGKLKGGLATSPVDGEGIPQQTTPLIVKGVLKNCLFDCYCAKKGKTKSTGNRSRGSYRNPGGIGPTNLFLQPGSVKPEEIFSGIKRGFYLTVVLGLFAGIDATSGDFSIPAAGFIIDKGKVTFPVRGISIGGNLFEFLKSIDKIGDDLTWFQSLASPTFSVKSIKIGGTAGK